MIADIKTMMWKESRELLRQRGSLKSTLMSLAVPLLMAGVLMPWQMGPLFLRWPWIAVAMCAWLPFLFVAVLIPESFAGERERHTLETLLASRLPDRAILFGKLAISGAYGVVLSGLIAGIGVVVVYAAHGQGRSALPFLWFWFAMTAAAVPLSFFVSSAGILVSLRAGTVRQSMQALSVAAFLPMLPLIFAAALPVEWRRPVLDAARRIGATRILVAVMIVILAAGIAVFARVLVRFRRDMLIINGSMERR